MVLGLKWMQRLLPSSLLGSRNIHVSISGLPYLVFASCPLLIVALKRAVSGLIPHYCSHCLAPNNSLVVETSVAVALGGVGTLAGVLRLLNLVNDSRGMGTCLGWTVWLLRSLVFLNESKLVLFYADSWLLTP